MIRYTWLLLALGGCFVEGGFGGAATPHAPPEPSGDGGYARGGVGVGWGGEYGTLQVSGAAMSVGGVAAIGGAVQANIFIVSNHLVGGHADAGWCAIARAYKGTGIGDSVGTEEYSIGAGYAAWGYQDWGDWAFDNMGLVFSAYRTTFADRDPMWSYGVNLTFAIDPVLLGQLITGDHR